MDDILENSLLRENVFQDIFTSWPAVCVCVVSDKQVVICFNCKEWDRIIKVIQLCQLYTSNKNEATEHFSLSVSFFSYKMICESPLSYITVISVELLP